MKNCLKEWCEEMLVVELSKLFPAQKDDAEMLEEKNITEQTAEGMNENAHQKIRVLSGESENLNIVQDEYVSMRE